MENLTAYKEIGGKKVTKTFTEIAWAAMPKGNYGWRLKANKPKEEPKESNEVVTSKSFGANPAGKKKLKEYIIGMEAEQLETFFEGEDRAQILKLKPNGEA